MGDRAARSPFFSSVFSIIHLKSLSVLVSLTKNAVDIIDEWHYNHIKSERKRGT